MVLLLNLPVLTTHAGVNEPVGIWKPKLSTVGLDQFYDGWSQSCLYLSVGTVHAAVDAPILI
jgi:hypothetical protein